MPLTARLMSILFLVLTAHEISGNNFVIHRRRPDGGQLIFKRSKDSFTISFSLCNRTYIAGEECERYNETTSGEECSCSCPLDRASFAYLNNEWKCQENSNVRDLQGKK